MKDMQEEIRKVSERAELLQIKQQYDEQEVYLKILDVLAEYGLSVGQLRLILAKRLAPQDALIKVDKASKVLGVSPQWLRQALQRNEFPEFGKAVSTGKNSYHYIIFKKKFEDFTGAIVD